MVLSPLWLPVTLAAALFQCWRTALQQRLRGQLSVNGAAVVRYLYGVPVGAALLTLYLLAFGGGLPAPNAAFLMFCAAGGLAQILGTNLLIMAFGHRGFAVGTAYAKTEAVQGAVLALALLGERISPLAWFGIAVGVAGVLWLSLAGRDLSPRELLRATAQPAALCGLAAGTGFASTVSSVGGPPMAVVYANEAGPVIRGTLSFIFVIGGAMSLAALIAVGSFGRDEALASGPRVVIDTPSIKGSINLKGARIDDVVLKKYRETVNPSSPNVVLLSPSGAPNAYYAEHGWVAEAGKDVVVRGTYDVAGFRADADLMVWWHASSADALQEAYTRLRRTALGRHLDPVWSQMALHRPAEFNRSHIPAFLADEEPRRYVCVYPFVRSYEWYLLPDEERRDMLKEHGMQARPYPDVRANTVAAFALGDYEWMLAFEADELHRIVDLMRDLRASRARRHVREEVPFYTGVRKPVSELIRDLA